MAVCRAHRRTKRSPGREPAKTLLESFILAVDCEDFANVVVPPGMPPNPPAAEIWAKSPGRASRY
jgi:peptidoglycan hydrolase-like amidase